MLRPRLSALESGPHITKRRQRRPFVLVRHTKNPRSVKNANHRAQLHATDVIVDRLDIWNNDGNYNLSTHKTAFSPMFATLMQSNADNFLFWTYKKKQSKKPLNIQCTCQTFINILFMLTKILDPFPSFPTSHHLTSSSPGFLPTHHPRCDSHLTPAYTI